MQQKCDKSTSGPKVVDLTKYLPDMPEKLYELNEVPVEMITSHFNLRGCLGEGIYCLRIYDEKDQASSLMSGVIWEKSTGDVNLTNYEDDPRTLLVDKLIYFYKKRARKEVKTTDSLCIMRDFNLSFMAIKCQVGMIVAGWFDTHKTASANGVHMLAYILQTLGALNPQDPVLKKASRNETLKKLTV